MTDDRKALFFDVDGTLMGEGGIIPESAKEALRRAREKGSLVFINTGRPYGLAKSILDKVEADGLLCGCGTELVIEGESVYEYIVPDELTKELKKDCVKMNFDLCLEGRDGVTFSDSLRIKDAMDVEAFSRSEGGLSGYKFSDDFEINKFCIQADKETDFYAFKEKYEKYFEIIDRRDGFYECVPLGHSKATAVKYVLDKYGISPENAYAFGDSANDVAMLKAVPNAIIMGEHDKTLEEYASFITKRLEDDGIMYAMEALGII